MVAVAAAGLEALDLLVLVLTVVMGEQQHHLQ
jgi:hypothetical protein